MKTDEEYLEIAKNLLEKWRRILLLDPIWEIDIEVYFDMEEAELGRINTSATEYFKTDLELSKNLFDMGEEDFVEQLEEIICHELTHLVMIDFFRTASLIAVENEKIQKELEYKYEQFTTRIQRAFTQLDNENKRLRAEKEKE